MVQAAIDRVLPHNLEAERVLLGAMLLKPQAQADVAAAVRAEEFFRDAHQRIYRAAAVLAETGTPVDLVTLKNELGRTSELEECGGPAYIASLVDGLPALGASHIAYYAAIVRERARLRQLILAANVIVAEAYAAEERAARIAERGMESLLGVLDSADASGAQTVNEALGVWIDAQSRVDATPPLRTGYADLDGLVGGVRSGELVVLAARPSVGKTSLAIGLAEHAAKRGEPGVFFPIETGNQSVAERLVALRSGVQILRVTRGEVTSAEIQRVVDAACEPAIPFELREAARTVAEIAAQCRQAARKLGPLRWVIVDYLQLLLAERRRESDEAEVALISRGLKRMARELKTVVIALSQLSRGPTNRRDNRPRLSDLRGSGALEADCDMAWLLYREEMHRPKPENEGIAEVIVAKNRNGPTGTVKLAWLKDIAAFANLEMRF